MKLDAPLLSTLKEHNVVPGNIYPAQGGRKKPGTTFWLVVAVSETGAHLIGFDDCGRPVSTASYGKNALRGRPLLGKADLDNFRISISVEKS